MPIAASSIADAAKTLSRVMLKSLRAVDCDTTRSIERMCANGMSRFTDRIWFWIAVLREYGSTLVRTTQVSGCRLLLRAVMPSFTCATGMYMMGPGLVLS